MPPISVVVTVKNDPRVVRCLEAILGQDTSFPFEVIVDVDGSTDSTPERVHERFHGNDHVTIIRTTGRGVAEGWNEAAGHSTAPIKVRVDADTIPQPGWLEALASPLIDEKADWSAGPVVGTSLDTLVERYVHHRTVAYCTRFEEADELAAPVPSWNVAYTASILDQSGGYDPWFEASEDWDLHKRLLEEGARGTFVPEAKIAHHHPSTLGGFFRKEAWYRTGQYQMMLKHGFPSVASSFVLPSAYALVLLLLVTGLAIPWAALAGVGLLAALLFKHAQGGRSEGDPLWWARPLFRPVEAVAGIYGIARGMARYGVRLADRGSGSGDVADERERREA